MSLTIQYRTMLVVLMILILITISPLSYSLSSTISSFLLIPTPNLYNMISANRILIPYKQLHNAIIEGKNYNVLDNGIIVLGAKNIDGNISISFPHPNPMLILYPCNNQYANISIIISFSEDLVKWSIGIYVNKSGYNIVSIKGTDYVGGKEYLFSPIVFKDNMERIEIGFMRDIIYFYVKSTGKSWIRYYPLHEEKLKITKIVIQGHGELKGEVFSIEPVSYGKEIIIQGLEQQLVNEKTYYIVESNTVFFGITPSRVSIELLKPTPEISMNYSKTILSAINTNYATGSLRLHFYSSVSGTNISLQADFFYLVNVTKLINVYDLNKIMLRFDFYSLINEFNESKKYYLGTRTLTITKGSSTIYFEDIPSTARNISVDVYVISSGIYYGESPLKVHEEKLFTITFRTFSQSDSYNEERNVSIIKPFIKGYIVFTRRYNILSGNYLLEIKTFITHYVDMIKLLKEVYPNLINYYLVLEVNDGEHTYSVEGLIENGKASLSINAPLSNSYEISVYLKVPGIVVGKEYANTSVKELIANYKVNIVALEPRIAILVPSELVVEVEKNQDYVKLHIPVRVYWIDNLNVVLATPTIYEVYVYDRVEDLFKLVYASTLPWLSNAEVNVYLPTPPLTNNTTLPMLVKVRSLIGKRWIEETKKFILYLVPKRKTVKTNTTTNTTSPTITFPPNTSFPPNFTITKTITTTIIITIPTTFTETKTLTVKLNATPATIEKTITKTVTSITKLTTTITKVSFTTSIKSIPTTIYRTITITLSLPEIMVSPPYSIGVGLLALLASLLIGLTYIRVLYRKRAR